MQGQIVRRGGRGRVEAQRDREIVEWIARFRFVTAEVLAGRFGLSPQRVNARLRRLEAAGIVRREACGRGEARAVFVTASGARRLDLPVRRAPRTDAQRLHELAIARLASELELESDDATDPRTRVLTEREQRTAERVGTGRFHVDLKPGGRGDRERWADLVVLTPARTVAIELELSMKAPDRLRRIVAGYAAAHHFDEVQFLAGTAPIAARLAKLTTAASHPSALAELLDLSGPTLSVLAWP